MRRAVPDHYSQIEVIIPLFLKRKQEIDQASMYSTKPEDSDPEAPYLDALDRMVKQGLLRQVSWHQGTPGRSTVPNTRRWIVDVLHDRGEIPDRRPVMLTLSPAISASLFNAPLMTERVDPSGRGMLSRRADAGPMRSKKNRYGRCVIRKGNVLRHGVVGPL